MTSIKIRGTYSKTGVGFLDDVKLQSALLGAAGSTASWVETCECPQGAFPVPVTGKSYLTYLLQVTLDSIVNRAQLDIDIHRLTVVRSPIAYRAIVITTPTFAIRRRDVASVITTRWERIASFAVGDSTETHWQV